MSGQQLSLREEEDAAMELASCCSYDESFNSMDASFSEDESFCYDTDEEEDMDSISSATMEKEDELQELRGEDEGGLPTENIQLITVTNAEDKDDELLASMINRLSSNHQAGNTHTRLNLNFHSLVAFMHNFENCRRWKRDQHFHAYGQVDHFQNTTIKEVQISGVPSDIFEGFFGYVIMMVVYNFAALERISVDFIGNFVNPQAALMRVALTALSHSRSLIDFKFGDHGDAQDSCFLEASASRDAADLLRVLKLRCNGDQLMGSESYMAVAQMLDIHRQSLNGLVLETAVDHSCALAIANTLGHKNNLTALCLGTFDCQDKTIRAGLISLIKAASCPQHSSLDYLSLVCQELDDTGAQDLAAAIHGSKLKELILFLDNEMEHSISGRGIAVFAKILEGNNSLEDYTLICNAIDDEGLSSMANILKSNRTLRNLKLQCTYKNNVTARGYQALVCMLKENLILESLDLGCREPDDEDDMEEHASQCPSDIQSVVSYYLKLNRAGVRDLHVNSNATPGKFVMAIASQRNELDNLYYMLSMNPSIIASASSRA